MFVDEAKIYVRSGNGGDGIVAFRREKYVPRGGPSGGDGGRGGNVILRVDKSFNTLSYFRRNNHFKASHGEKGGSSNRTGADAEDLILSVPPGTLVRNAETGKVIADLVHHGDTVLVARGGRGGRGNARFATSSNRAPRIAEKGEPGEEAWLLLELKLIADVGIVGVPNAGKSTLLSVISNAKPQIAPYPFTTLEPNLGVVTLDDRELVFADIPGLIEGAHQGVGLGHSFLRHVQRTKVLVHLIDGSSSDPLADYSQIMTELALYDEKLAQRPQVVAFNKMDLLDAQERWPLVEKTLKRRGIDVLPISGATQQNILLLLRRVFRLVENLPLESAEDKGAVPVYELPEEAPAFTISRTPDGAFVVQGKQIERAAAMTYWDYDEAVNRFQRILETLGITEALIEAGVQVGDTVFIGDHELEWSE